jgi:hypothetical protein
MRSSNEDIVLYVSNHYWWRDICRVTGLGMEKISLKVSMGLLRQKEVVYFSLLIRKVIVSL